ncbi:MAG: hypothetical protein JNK82_03785, partial [Myxococcaceae bacterium]|nr:hypothetical protein [Myxococcaceae bacterium]
MRRVAIVLAGLVGLLLVAVLVSRLMRAPTELEVQVVSRTWKLTVGGFEPWVDRRSSWCSAMPHDAKPLERSRREKRRASRGQIIEYDEWCVYEVLTSNRAANADRTGRF